jgi:hypothetical protein
MASMSVEPFFLNTSQFAEKVYAQFQESVDTEQRKNISLDMLNFNISFTPKQGKNVKINLCNFYKKCFVDFYGKLSPDEVDSLIDEFVTNWSIGLKGKTPLSSKTGLGKVKNNIFPIVRRATLIDDHNRSSCSTSADNTITFFPFRCLPSIGVSLATIQGSLISSIHKGMIKNWCKESKAGGIFKTYSEKEDPQLDLILDTAEHKGILSKEEIALLHIAKENFYNLIKKKYKKGNSMWYRYPSSAYKALLDGQEYLNLFGTLLLLPELIAQSQLKVKGDIIAVAAEESVLFVGGSQEPLALCFIGESALDYQVVRNHISLEPLRLVESGGGLWKWLHYVPNLEKRESSVPINKAQVDMIFKSIETGTHKNNCSPIIPVFKNYSTPLTEQSQEEIKQNLEAQKAEKPHTTLVPICWNCGANQRKLKQCEGCLLARYCERKCQKAHWKSHKTFCKSKSAAKST